MNCPQCGASLSDGTARCQYCGENISTQQPAAPVYQQPPYQQQPYQQQPPYYQPGYPGSPYISPTWPIKSKVTAGILGILLGGLGIHKFYLGKIGLGIVYLLFCWTYIPAIIGLIEGIMYLSSSDESFQQKNHVRLM